MDFILSPDMGSTINTKVGFSFDNGVLRSIIVGMDGIKKSVFGASESVVRLNKKFGDLSKVQGLSSLSTVISNSVGGIKSLVGYASKLNDFFTSYADRGDKIAKNSRLVGMSVKDYQNLGYVAGMSGISIEELDSSLIRFNANLAKARSGDKSAKKMFNSLLPKKAKLSDYKNSIDVLKAISDGYTKIKNSEDKAYASQELFGKSGVKMTELLSSGSKALVDSMNEAPEGFTEDGAKSAEDFGDALSKIKLKLDGIVVTVAQDLFPIFTEMFNEISGYLKQNGTLITGQLKQIGSLVAEFVKDLLPRIPKILDFIINLVDSIGPGWVAAASAVVTMLPALSQIVLGILAVKPIVLGVGSALIGVFAYAKTVIWAVITAFKVATTVLGGPFFATIGLVVAAVVSWGIAIKSVWDNFDLLMSFIQDIAVKIGDFCSMVADKILGLFYGLDDFLSSIASGIGDFCMDALSGIFDFVKKINSVIQGVISVVPGKLKNLFGIGDSIDVNANISSAPSQIATAVQQSYSVTTNRFAVDFNNVPRGTNITPPPQGDFDWSRSYTLAGAV